MVFEYCLLRFVCLGPARVGWTGGCAGLVCSKEGKPCSSVCVCVGAGGGTGGTVLKPVLACAEVPTYQLVGTLWALHRSELLSHKPADQVGWPCFGHTNHLCVTVWAAHKPHPGLAPPKLLPRSCPPHHLLLRSLCDVSVPSHSCPNALVFGVGVGRPSVAVKPPANPAVASGLVTSPPLQAHALSAVCQSVHRACEYACGVELGCWKRRLAPTVLAALIAAVHNCWL